MTRVTRLSPRMTFSDLYSFGDVYNWRTSNTRRLQRSLGNALAGTGYCDQLFVGDSETAWFTGTPAGGSFTQMWPRVMRTLLNARGIPLGGTGWVNPFGSGNITYMDPRWARTGSWAFGGSPSWMQTSTSGATLTFTSDLPGTAIAIAYFQNSGPFTVSVDGAAAVTVTPPGTPTTATTYTVTGLANTTHTIAITTTSTTTVYFVAAQVYGATGLRLHNFAIGGSQAVGTWDNIGSNVTVIPVTKALLPDPDVLHLALGVNDLNAGGKTPAQVVTALTTIRGQFPNADVILHGQYQPSAVSTANWSAYIQALYQLAVTFNCPLVDLYQRSGGYTVANSNAMMGDTIHPTIAAQADWGLLATNLMMKAAI